MLLLVSYDLKSTTKDYNSLYEVIKGLGGWWHYLDSTWIVKTCISVSDVTDRLKAAMDDADNLFVVDISGQARNGWLPSKAWEWIRAHDEPITGENTTNPPCS